MPRPMGLEQRVIDAGLKMTGQRRIILKVLEGAEDHPSIETVHRRVRRIDPGISIATVYRTMNLLGELNLVRRNDFSDNQARFETNLEHHHHLIDVNSGEVVEFQDQAFEDLIGRIAARLGFDLVDHKLELYGRRKRK